MKIVNNKIYIMRGETPTYDVSVIDKNTGAPFVIPGRFEGDNYRGMYNPVVEFAVRPDIYSIKDNYAFKVYMPYHDEIRFNTTSIEKCTTNSWDTEPAPSADKQAKKRLIGDVKSLTGSGILTFKVERGNYFYVKVKDGVFSEIVPSDGVEHSNITVPGVVNKMTISADGNVTLVVDAITTLEYVISDKQIISDAVLYGLTRDGKTEYRFYYNDSWIPYVFRITFTIPYANDFREVEGQYSSVGGSSELEVRTYRYEVSLFDAEIEQTEDDVYLKNITFKKPIIEPEEFVVGGSTSE